MPQRKLFRILYRLKKLRRFWGRFRQDDGIAFYWTVVTALGSVLSVAVLPFDFRYLDAPPFIPILVRLGCAVALAAGAALPALFKDDFSERVFPAALIAAATVMSASISYLETLAIQTMYFNGLYQLFVAFAFMRVSLAVAVTIYALPVALYRGIAGAAHFEAAQPEFLLFTVVGFAVNQGLRAADARRMQKANHETLVQWARSSAHELKGPLIAIRMIAHDLLERSDIDPQIREGVLEMQKLCQRGLAVQNRILMNARYQAPEFADLQPMYAGESIQKALSEYEFRTPGQEELITVNIDPDFEFNGDPILFVNVVHNLIANALRAILASDNGEIIINVGIADDSGLIEFRDTGPGIEADQLRSIFTPGVTFSGGTGFGLTFCKAVVESFSGTITCESTPGELTVFSILIPLN